ncbi:unnamed protein product [Calypogeia fissa]
MALSFSTLIVSSSPKWSYGSSLTFRHEVQSGRKNLPPIGSVDLGSENNVGPSRQQYTPAVSHILGRDGVNSLHIRSQNNIPTQRRLASFRVCCNNLQGEPIAEDRLVEKEQGPHLRWILLAAGVAAAAVLALKLNGGRLPNMGSSGQALALQADQGLVPAVSSEGAARFNVKLPGLGNLSLGEVTPGWVYFMLLMAAGCGLFVSEEALNVWVGASLARLLTYGSKQELMSSLSANAPYIISTILWVYWGVCISDMVPFYAGKLASKTGDQLSQKLGVSKEKYEQVKANVQRYGNLIGFVERFSLGVRNPTSFLAGVAGISPAKFFAGVCVGGLLTLPLQMSVGFVLRERPVAALAAVAAVVGTWTVFPYAIAGLASLYYLVLRKLKPSQ